MLSKKNILGATLATAAAALLVITQTAGTTASPQSTKLEGAWIYTVPGTPVLATMHMSPDASGLRAAISGQLVVPIPATQAFPDNEFVSDFVGEAVMTGPYTAEMTIIGYGSKEVVPTLQSPFDRALVLIWVGSGTMKFTASGKIEGVQHLAYYRPEADTNGDGFPEAAPLYSIDGPAVCTRVGLMSSPTQ